MRSPTRLRPQGVGDLASQTTVAETTRQRIRRGDIETTTAPQRRPVHDLCTTATDTGTAEEAPCRTGHEQCSPSTGVPPQPPEQRPSQA